MRIVVTGSEGYIGSAVCFMLRQCFNPSAPAVEVLSLDVKAGDRGDITKKETLASVFEFHPDLVINLAGVSGESAARDINRDDLWAVNAVAPVQLRKAAYGALFVQAGTTSALDENAGDSLYASSKLAAERGLTELEPYKGELVLLRFGTVVGRLKETSLPFRWDLPIHRMIKDAVTKKKITIPLQRIDRPWLALDELLEVLGRLVLEKAGEFRISSPHPVPVVSWNATLEKVAQFVATETGAEIERDAGHKDLRSYSSVPLAGGRWNPKDAGSIICGVIAAAKEEFL